MTQKIEIRQGFELLLSELEAKLRAALQGAISSTGENENLPEYQRYSEKAISLMEEAYRGAVSREEVVAISRLYVKIFASGGGDRLPWGGWPSFNSTESRAISRVSLENPDPESPEAFLAILEERLKNALRNMTEDVKEERWIKYETADGKEWYRLIKEAYEKTKTLEEVMAISRLITRVFAQNDGLSIPKGHRYDTKTLEKSAWERVKIENPDPDSLEKFLPILERRLKNTLQGMVEHLGESKEEAMQYEQYSGEWIRMIREAYDRAHSEEEVKTISNLHESLFANNGGGNVPDYKRYDSRGMKRSALNEVRMQMQ